MTEQLVRPVGSRPRSVDTELRRRARAVIPGAMYGHQSAGPLPAEYPQFMRAGRGALRRIMPPWWPNRGGRNSMSRLAYLTHWTAVSI